MAAVFLYAVSHEFPATASAFYASGLTAHRSMSMPPTHPADIRAELFFLPAGRVLQYAAALPAHVLSRRRCLTDRFYSVTLTVGFHGVHRQAQLSGNFRISHPLPALLGDQQFLSVCHTISFAFLVIVVETSSHDLHP